MTQIPMLPRDLIRGYAGPMLVQALPLRAFRTYSAL